MSKLTKVATASISCILGAHMTATVLQNTPESFNQNMKKFVFGWTVPGWRFFAPNPGIQNVHLLVRHVDGESGSGNPTNWSDITPSNSHGLLETLWNPGSRGPKALFDAMQQISLMSSNYSDFAIVLSSSAYEIVSGAAKRDARENNFTSTQFLLINYFPSKDNEENMQPIVVSDWIDVQ
ncbi:DUF5819 family protein [Auritidibacter ignavus]|uniref:DUF5819 family protein n=1 Tax=Auritidibacter ignavus TaxID=678932 RepID=A0AAJ6AIG5_9MICC|nr:MULTISPECIES: DUF5819 family protein [Auritidibacter]AXR73801.1 hypothetical protein DCC27_005260 [Auritidibacter sp. NML130574]WGH94086.1 DUF5819 family protein [Auritidibacter ignavus]WHS27619.1 DUF5819 family protein [Auritidibacter ignavus]